MQQSNYFYVLLVVPFPSHAIYRWYATAPSSVEERHVQSIKIPRGISAGCRQLLKRAVVAPTAIIATNLEASGRNFISNLDTLKFPSSKRCQTILRAPNNLRKHLQTLSIQTKTDRNISKRVQTNTSLALLQKLSRLDWTKDDYR